METEFLDKLEAVWTLPKLKLGKFYRRECIIPPHLHNEFAEFWRKHKIKLLVQGFSFIIDKKLQWRFEESKTHLNDLYKPSNEVYEPLKPYKLKDSSGLKEWQPEAVSRICAALLKHGAAIDGSDTGTGKTYTLSAVARETRMPVGVICPKAVIETWKRVLKIFGVEYRFIINYESLKGGKYPDILKVARAKNGQRQFVWMVPKKTLILFDESHKLKGQTSLNSKIAINCKKQGYKIVLASATNAISPIEMKATGFILGLHEGGNKNFTKWLMDNGCRQGRFGWCFSGEDRYLSHLNKRVFFERGVRLRRDDIPTFPECDTQAIAYDMDEFEKKALNKIYDEMKKELKVLERKSGLTDAQKNINALTLQLRARQKAELVKVPLFVEMIEDSIQDGLSIVVMLNFSETIEALSKRLNTKCIVWGKNKGTERQDFVDAFQADKERVILINVKAGGAGLSLHDLNGKYPRMCLLSPTPSAVDLRQALGRVHRAEAKTKALQRIIFVSGTEEEKTCQSVKIKLQYLDSINDGDLVIGGEFKL